MGKVKDREFWQSAKYNNVTFMSYYNRLAEIGFSRFRWENLPESVNERFLERVLFSDGAAIFFKDDILGFLALRFTTAGGLDVYMDPIKRRAYGSNGYQKLDLDMSNSVIIYNNYLRLGCIPDIEAFAKRLYNIDRTIDVNVNAQKTPVLLQCSDSQRLTLKNLYMQYEGNAPFIFATRDLDLDSIRTLRTDAPFVSPALYDLKVKIWNEALTYLGIANLSINKKERLISDEVQKNQGGTIASRYSPLEARKQAAEQINKMFGLDIKVSFRMDESEETSEPEQDESEVVPDE